MSDNVYKTVHTWPSYVVQGPEHCRQLQSRPFQAAGSL